MQKIFTLLLSFLPSVAAFSQTDLLFNNHHINFRLGFLSNSIQHQVITKNKGEFTAIAANGAYFGGGFMINPYPNLGLEVGMNVSIQSYGYRLVLDSSDFAIPSSLERTEILPELYFELPFVAIPRIQLNAKNMLYAKLGVTMSWYIPTQFDFDIKSPPFDPKASDLSDVRVTFPGRNPYLGTIGGIGWQRLLKSKDLIGVEFLVNTNFKNVLQGQYRIWDMQRIVGTGQFNSNGSYWSLAVTYTFTGVKHIERQLQLVDFGF